MSHIYEQKFGPLVNSTLRPVSDRELDKHKTRILKDHSGMVIYEPEPGRALKAFGIPNVPVELPQTRVTRNPITQTTTRLVILI